MDHAHGFVHLKIRGCLFLKLCRSKWSPRKLVKQSLGSKKKVGKTKCCMEQKSAHFSLEVIASLHTRHHKIGTYWTWSVWCGQPQLRIVSSHKRRTQSSQYQSTLTQTTKHDLRVQNTVQHSTQQHVERKRDTQQPVDILWSSHRPIHDLLVKINPLACPYRLLRQMPTLFLFSQVPAKLRGNMQFFVLWGELSMRVKPFAIVLFVWKSVLWGEGEEGGSQCTDENSGRYLFGCDS